jgi:hypothetical protein
MKIRGWGSKTSMSFAPEAAKAFLASSAFSSLRPCSAPKACNGSINFQPVPKFFRDRRTCSTFDLVPSAWLPKKVWPSTSWYVFY